MNGNRIIRGATAFLRDEERGSATIWNLFWLCGFGALLGLGLDTTAAMNTKGKLQMVADTAAHAGVIDIFPVAASAVDTALVYGSNNILGHADVVTDSDVTVGHWDPDSRTFSTEDVPNYNAVRVMATRDTGRENALGTFFLRVVGFYDWDIKSASTAAYFDDISENDRCRKEGLMAGGQMEQTANNIVIGDYCLHGEGGVKITQNNYIECGVEISLPDASLWLSQAVATPSGVKVECNENYKELTNDEMIAQVVKYRRIPSQAGAEFANVRKVLDAYIAAYHGGPPLNDPFDVIPPYITHVVTTSAQSFNQLVKNKALTPGALYRIGGCASTGGTALSLAGIVRNIGIYTNCRVDVTKETLNSTVPTSTPAGNYGCAEALAAGYKSYDTLLDTADGQTYRDGVTVDNEAQKCGILPGATALLDNVFIFTTSTATINFPNDIQLGRFDGCTEGGAVRLYSAGSISSPAGIRMHGSHMIVLGDVDLAAKGSAYGMTVEAKGNIRYSAQGQFTGCPAAEDKLASDVVLTVRPVAIVQ